MLSLKRTCVIGFSHLGVESIWMLIFVYITQRGDSPSPRPTGENPVWVTFSLFPSQGRGRAYLIGILGKKPHSGPFLQAVMSQFPDSAPPMHPHPWAERLPVPCSLHLGGRPGLSYAEEELPAPTLNCILHHKGAILAFLKRYVLQFNEYFSVFRSQQEKRDVVYCIFSKIPMEGVK